MRRDRETRHNAPMRGDPSYRSIDNPAGLEFVFNVSAAGRTKRNSNRAPSRVQDRYECRLSAVNVQRDGVDMASVIVAPAARCSAGS